MPTRHQLRSSNQKLTVTVPLSAYGERMGSRLLKHFAAMGAVLFKETLLVEVPETTSIPADALRLARHLREAGVISAWRKVPRDFPDEPPLQAFEGIVGDSIAGNGAHVEDEAGAFMSMLVESQERTAWNKDWAGKYEVRKARYGDLPGSVEAFGADSRTEITWIRLPSFSDSSRCWVPLQCVSPAYIRTMAERGGGSEPSLGEITTSGLASGTTRGEAAVGAILELIERDALMRAYEAGSATDIVSLSDEMTDLSEECARYGLTLHLRGLKSPFPVHCIVAIVEDRSNLQPHLTTGSAAHWSLEKACRKALAEALFARHIFRREHLDTRPLPQGAMWGPLDRASFWGNRTAADLPHFTGAGAPYRKKVADVMPPTAADTLRKALREQNIRVCVAECTDDVGSSVGLSNVFAVSPNLKHLTFRVPPGEIPHPFT